MADGAVVGSAEFELRASRAKIQGDMEAARREVEASAKRTEATLAQIVGTGTVAGAKRAADAERELAQAIAGTGTISAEAIRVLGGFEAVHKRMAEAAAASAKQSDTLSQALETEAQQNERLTKTVEETARAYRERTAAIQAEADLPGRTVQNSGDGGFHGPVGGQGDQIKTAAADMAKLDAEAEKLRRSLDPLYAAQAKYDDEIDRAHHLLSKGAISQETFNKALKQSDRALKDTEKGLGDVGKSSDRAANGLGGFNVKAVLTTLGLASLAVVAVKVVRAMWDIGRAAMQSAGEISGTAKKIGVSTDALQEWRHVATRTGQDAKAADQALTSFGEKLALAGSKLGKNNQALQDFKALGFSPEQLKSFKSTEEALDAVVDRIGDLKSESDRAAIAERLGLGALGVALRKGADEIANLRDEAHQLGAVMGADVVSRGAEAQSQFETLSRVIDVQLKTAFVDLAPVITSAIGLVNDLAKALADALQEWKGLESKSLSGLKAHRETLQTRKDGIAAEYGTERLDRFLTRGPVVNPDGSVKQPSTFRRVMEATPLVGGLLATTFAPQQNVGEQFDNLTTAIAATDKRIAELEQTRRDNAPVRADNAGGTNLIPAPTKPKVDRAAEREARRAERVEQEIFRARQRALGIADKEALTVQERYDLAQAQVKLEREAEAAELESKLARGEYKKGEYDQLKLIHTQTATLEDRVASDILARDLADERLAKERALTDLTADLLSLQSGAARTAKEHREIELRLLAMAQQRAREDLDRDLERTPGLSDDDKKARRDALGQVQKAQTAAVNRQTMSPLEAWRDESLKTADEIREAYENVAARGLDALNDGIVDAIMNSRDLGEVFSNVARSIIADLTKIAVRRSITEPLANMLFGDGQTKGGSGSGWMSAAANAVGSFFGGGRAFGGPVRAGMAYRVGEHGPETLMMPKNGFVVPDGAFSESNTTNGPRSMQPVPMHFDLSGAVITADLLRQINAAVENGEARVRGDIPGLAVSAVRDAQERYAF